LARILFGLQCLTLVVLIMAPIPSEVRFQLLILLLLLSLRAKRQSGASPSHRITEVRIDDTYAARLVFADGRLLQTSLRGDSLISNNWILLRFEGERFFSRPSLLLDRDALPADEMRRLRVMLNAGRRGAADDRHALGLLPVITHPLGPVTPEEVPIAAREEKLGLIKRTIGNIGWRIRRDKPKGWGGIWLR
jgi:hypothetical protein